MDRSVDGRDGSAPASPAFSNQDREEVTRARLAAIVNSCPDPIIGETLDGIIADWNPAAERLYGYAAEEVIGQPLTLICPTQRLYEIGVLRERVLRGDTVEDFETVRRAKDGRLIDVSLTIFPVQNERGELIGASTIARDISQRKAAEAESKATQQDTHEVWERIDQLSQELRVSEAKYRALVEQLPGAVYLLAADEMETPLYYSPYVETLLGATPEEMLKRGSDFHWLEYIHPDDRDRIAELNNSTIENEYQFRAEYRAIRTDGSYVWVRDESLPIFDDDGKVVAWQGVVLDISDRIEAEEAQARLAAIVESAEDAISGLALDGVITSWNRGAEQLYGFRADEVIGQSFAVLLPENGDSDALAQFALSSEQPTHFEARRRRVDGTEIDAAISLSPIRDRSGSIIGVSSITRDITERKRADEELRVALEEAQAATHAKSRFLAILSHELRTPLQAVLGYADFLLNGPSGVLSAEQREDIGFIYRGATRMVTLIDQMLDLSRMEAGRLELKITDVELGEIIEQVRQDVAPQAEAKGLTLTVSVPTDLPPVCGDAERLRQIVLNLAGNAVKFTEAGGIRISAVPAPHGGVDVAVSDSGIGIAPEALERIFEEFQQVDSALTRRHGGAGLGLSIARGLAERMGGRISVTSQPGEGSTFTLHLVGDGVLG